MPNVTVCSRDGVVRLAINEAVLLELSPGEAKGLASELARHAERITGRMVHGVNPPVPPRSRRPDPPPPPPPKRREGR